MSSSTPSDPDVAELAARWRAEGCGLLMLRAAVRSLAEDDPSRLDSLALLDDTVAMHAEIEALRGAWLRWIAEADRREAATEEEGAPSTASWLRSSCLISGSAAAAAVQVARRLSTLPRVAEALEAGRIGFDAAKLLTRALTRARLDAAGEQAEELETGLVALAEVADPVLLRDKLREVTTQLDGDAADANGGNAEPESALFASRTLDDVVQVSGRFGAVDGAILLTALDATSAPGGPDDKRMPAERRAAGLIELITRALNGGQLPANGGERPHVGVLVPYDVLAANPASSPQPGAQPEAEKLWDFIGVASSEGAATPPEPSSVRVVEFFGLDRPDTASAVIHHVPQHGTRSGGRDARCDHLDRLLGRLHDRNGVGTVAWLTQTGPISPAAARLLACDSMVHRIVLGPDSIPLDVGRSARIVPAPLRRALLARDGGCAFPGCGRPPSWCQAHHIDHWADGGETSLDNCVLLCAFHHRLIHHTGWKVHAVPGGRPYFTRPGGTRYEGPRLPRAG